MNNTNVPSRWNIGQLLASNFNEIAVTIWTGASFYIMYATGAQSDVMLVLPLVAGVVFFVWMAAKKPLLAKVDPVTSLGVFLLSFAILASYLFNTQRYTTIFMVGNTVSAALFFITLYVITTKMNLDYRKLLVFQCLFSSPLFPLVLASSRLQWGRVMPAELTPNFVGMMALVCFLGACSMRSWLWTFVFSVLPLYTIVVMESRDAMVSGGIGASIILGYRLSRIGWKKLRPYVTMALLGGPIVCIALDLLGFDLFSHAYNAINNLFLINDEFRGVDSGGSGRTALWSAIINMWLDHPIFGIGFKGPPQMMPDQMLAHNGYLGVLAESGLVGFTGYMLIFVAGFYHTLKGGNRGFSDYPERLAIILSYAFYGMLESRGFSFGNTYSLLFLLVVFDSAKFRLKSPRAFGPPRTKPASPPLEPLRPRA